jgi:ABC transport system ATP-binding/permease protein
VPENSHAAPPLLVRTGHSDHLLDSGTEYRIGRDPEADIVLADGRVSWQHATVRADGQSWVLEDQGSSNGTYADGERTDRVDIRPGCVVRFGNPEDGQELRFELQPPPSERVPGPSLADVPGLPSVDRRPTARRPLSAGFVRIGRTPGDNDLVVSDLSVSRKHAVLRKERDGRYRIFDLGSQNGTYVNGARVEQAGISEHDIISIGHATFRLADGELREYVDTGDVALEARELTVVRSGKILLDDVSFPIEGRTLVGVIGPSGAGKSTLLNALNGIHPADTGTVMYDNRDLYRDFAELRHRIGFVPQKDIVHTHLTPRTALGYAAELRFTSDTHKAERAKRVDEVLEELSLTHRADVPAKNLSGGQVKRVNVALELLTRPSLLFLDEPTSGLDPGLDAQVMEQMRDLAHDGRTIIVVTHSVENLHTCDRLLVLVPGGRVAYYGPPHDALRYFGQSRWAEVFRAFHAQPDRDWAGEFRQTKEYTLYVANPMIPRPPHAQPPDRQRYGRHGLVPRPRGGRGQQLRTLTARYLRLIMAERLYFWLILLAPLGLGYFVRLTQTPQGLQVGAGIHSGAEETLLVLMITACLAGVFNSIREVVKERDIYNRERAAGLSAAAYLASKVLVLSVIAVYQAVVMTAIGLLGYRLPASGSLLTHAPFLELVLAVVLIELASTCLGLLVSTLVSSSDLAMQVLILPVMIQIVFSGAIFTLAGVPVTGQLSWFVPARWGMAALASTVRLNVVNQATGAKLDPLWSHTSGAWLLDMGMMLFWSVVYVLAAWSRQLGRLSPRRRK